MYLSIYVCEGSLGEQNAVAKSYIKHKQVEELNTDIRQAGNV